MKWECSSRPTVVNQTYYMLYIFAVVRLHLRLGVEERYLNSALFGCYIPSVFRYAVKYNIKDPLCLLVQWSFSQQSVTNSIEF